MGIFFSNFFKDSRASRQQCKYHLGLEQSKMIAFGGKNKQAGTFSKRGATADESAATFRPLKFPPSNFLHKLENWDKILSNSFGYVWRKASKVFPSIGAGFMTVLRETFLTRGHWCPEHVARILSLNAPRKMFFSVQSNTLRYLRWEKSHLDFGKVGSLATPADLARHHFVKF